MRVKLATNEPTPPPPQATPKLGKCWEIYPISAMSGTHSIENLPLDEIHALAGEPEKIPEFRLQQMTKIKDKKI